MIFSKTERGILSLYGHFKYLHSFCIQDQAAQHLRAEVQAAVQVEVRREAAGGRSGWWGFTVHLFTVFC